MSWEKVEFYRGKRSPLADVVRWKKQDYRNDPNRSKWGSSLFLLIGANICRQAGLKPGDFVEVAMRSTPFNGLMIYKTDRKTKSSRMIHPNGGSSNHVWRISYMLRSSIGQFIKSDSGQFKIINVTEHTIYLSL